MRQGLLRITVALVLFGAGDYYGAQPTMPANDPTLGTNIALHCPYTWNMAPNAFPDGYEGHGMCKDPKDDVQLTDGELATRCWWDERTVGWWFEAGYLNLTIDLGKEQPIAAVDFHLSSEDTGLRVPVWTGIFVSNDNKSFYPAGEIDKAEALRQWRQTRVTGEQDGNPHAWIGRKDLRAKGRYVILSFQSANLYLDEIRVFSGQLKAADINMPREGWRPNLSMRPFYIKPRAYVAVNVLTPIELTPISISESGHALCPDIYLDLPQGIALASPKNKADIQTIRWQDQPYNRYSVLKADRLFLESVLPTGTVSRIRMTGMPSCTNFAGMEQVLEIETIAIPSVSLFKTLLAAVPMDCAYCWTWPNMVENYKKLGLNLFMPCSGTDYYYRFMVHNIPEAHQLITSAKAAGLKVGGNFSPFCNIAIPQKRKAVFLSGKTSANGCPRGYLEQQQQDQQELREKGEVAQAVAGVGAGIDLFTFDSEPYWPGDICACPVCEQEWQRFLTRRAPDLPFLSQQEVMKDKGRNAAYLPLMQACWDDFYRQVWGLFRVSMEQQAGANRPVRIFLYGNPGSRDAALGLQGSLGNGGSFLSLFNEGIIDGANSCWYQAPTEKLGDNYVRTIRDALPPICPMYVWETAGGGSLAFERTAADFKNRLLELFFNGAQGFFIWNACGMDAKDYQAVAEVVRQIQPVERFVTNGKLLPLDAFDAPAGVRVRGIQLGLEAIVLVSRYNREDAADATLTLKLPVEAFPARIAEPLEGGPAVKFNNRQLSVHFTGAEGNWVQTFLIHP